MDPNGIKDLSDAIQSIVWEPKQALEAEKKESGPSRTETKPEEESDISEEEKEDSEEKSSEQPTEPKETEEEHTPEKDAREEEPEDGERARHLFRMISKRSALIGGSVALVLAILLGSVFYVSKQKQAALEEAARLEAEEEEARRLAALSVTPTPIPSPTPTPEPVMSETMTGLLAELEEMTQIEGQTWDVYVKDLLTGEEVMTGDEEMYAASLIKLYVMEYWMDRTRENPEQLDENVCSRGSLRRLLTDMIEVSDNESYNELVRQAGGGSAEEGFRVIGEWLKDSGYPHTGIFHTLHPSSSDPAAISEEKNHSSVSDCAYVLEKIYAAAHTGDAQGQFMMSLLEAQTNRTKIVAGLPDGIETANKTGETDEVQHDAAIVYGDKTHYILVVMGSSYQDEGDAIEVIRDISSLVYERLNPPAESTSRKKVSERRRKSTETKQE